MYEWLYNCLSVSRCFLPINKDSVAGCGVLAPKLYTVLLAFRRKKLLETMEHHHQHGNGMYSPVSTTSSSGSGASDSDEFGLRTLRCFYSPYLVSELERLFISSPLEVSTLVNNHYNILFGLGLLPDCSTTWHEFCDCFNVNAAEWSTFLRSTLQDRLAGFITAENVAFCRI